MKIKPFFAGLTHRLCIKRVTMLRRLPPKNLIITSDDFGYSEERDDGIVQCFRHGAISCVSLMVNGLSVCSAVEKAAQIGMPMGKNFSISKYPRYTLEIHFVTFILNTCFYMCLFI